MHADTELTARSRLTAESDRVCSLVACQQTVMMMDFPRWPGAERSPLPDRDGNQKADQPTMPVKLRMRRLGRKNRAFFRVSAVDSRAKRDGRVIEELGFYDPIEKKTEKAVSLKRDRIEYWLSQGAQPSITVATLLRQHGIKKPAAK